MKSTLQTFLAFIMMSLISFGDELADIKSDYKSADKELNEVYARAKKTFKKEDFQELQKDQREWIEGRDWLAEFQARGEPLATSAEYWEAMKMYTEERVEYLKAWLTVKPKDIWEGTYKDCNGGTLTITKKDGKLTFSISVVRGPTFHMGEIEGRLVINKHKARFSDKGNINIHDAGEKTWLDFAQLGNGLQIEVTGTNTQPYHGARAYFDGTYRRMK